MSRQLLILTDPFSPPAFNPRVQSLAKFLTAEGWRCTVLTDRLPSDPPFRLNECEYHCSQYFRQKTRLETITDKLLQLRERYFERFVQKTVDVSEYDLIFCSTFYYFPLRTAARLAKKYHKPLVTDLRDIVEQWGNTPYMTTRLPRMLGLEKWLYRHYEQRFISFRNRVLRQSDMVVSVSEWHQQFLKQITPSVELIYNGFDEHSFTPKDETSDKFIITYTGKIYDYNFRDPRLLFSALQTLIKENRIDSQNVQLRFYINADAMDEGWRLIRKYGLENISSINPYISPEAIVSLMHQSSIWLVLTCKTGDNGPFGIMGTKFYEALGTEKPVLCVRSDEDCLEKVIRETNSGVSARTKEEAKDFISEKYSEWLRCGFTRQKVNQEKKQYFTRQYQNRQFMQLFQTLIG